MENNMMFHSMELLNQEFLLLQHSQKDQLLEIIITKRDKILNSMLLFLIFILLLNLTIKEKEKYFIEEMDAYTDMQMKIDL